jgi:hypothetical protein
LENRKVQEFLENAQNGNQIKIYTNSIFWVVGGIVASVKRRWELRNESLHESFLNSHSPVKREQELHESWEARVFMRVFSTLMPRSNENKSYMRVDESWWELRSESLHESFLNTHAPVKREQELHESWWELRSESLHESFLNSRAPVKREQELHDSWWELRSESLHESFLNSHSQVKREQELPRA